MKTILGVAGTAVLLASIVFSLLPGFNSGEKLAPLQADDGVIEIKILSRSFIDSIPHYEPANVTARVGAVVMWSNEDIVHHTATSDEGVLGALEGQIFDSGPIPPRSEFLLDTSRMPDGVYPYHCAIHPWARAKLTLVNEPITVTTDRPVYRTGEKVTVYGTVNIPLTVPGEKTTLPTQVHNETMIKSVSLKVFGDAKLVFSREVPVAGSGSYSYTFTAGKAGTYSAEAAVNSFRAVTTFRVEDVAEMIAIESVQFEDENGISSSMGTVGEAVLVKIELSTLGASQEFVYIVQVKDSGMVTVLLEWEKGSVEAGKVSKQAVRWVPEAAGDYEIEVFVWRSLDVPAPLTGPWSAGFLVGE